MTFWFLPGNISWIEFGVDVPNYLGPFAASNRLRKSEFKSKYAAHPAKDIKSGDLSAFWTRTRCTHITGFRLHFNHSNRKIHKKRTRPESVLVLGLFEAKLRQTHMTS